MSKPPPELSKLLYTHNSFIITSDTEISHEDLARTGKTMSMKHQRDIMYQEAERLKKELPVIRSSNFVLGVIVGAVVAIILNLIFIR